ncbi:conserved Plasmodium protein, unknown function [Plasmodium vivax]|uniref:Uncharacterized protein n=1 Tax=Plasmodium vivax TaxID=5855 RepID=A0A1G4H780_PLAVI|nr:conserved Plasmodium protein, unknown function [Plasmodium vivax]SCO65262.1 conserved Plasmodium protein, unknown function [Plasmodium vivax]SCO70753.1 conserved Plasmodium protein, unknown function [Plasmodium vivax]
MKLRVIALLLFLFSTNPVESYALKKKFAFLMGCKWAPRRRGTQLRLKINDVINFKDKEELKREIVTHSRRISLDLSDEQINNIGNNLYEFFSYLKLKDISIGVRRGRSKRSGKPLPLRWEDNKYEEFHTQNMKKEGDYYVEDSNNYSN